MMTFSSRAEDARELMDDPRCDERLLFNTYRQFVAVNRLFSNWGAVYRAYIRPALQRGRTNRLLDIGCGGGDVALDVYHRAVRDGFVLSVKGIDIDERALRFVRTRSWPAGFTFEHASTGDLVAAGATFDVVMGNHVLHHLSSGEVHRLADQAAGLATRLALFNDLERSRLAYVFFSAFAGLCFRDSYTARDGMTSIRRAFTADELKRLLPTGWDVERKAPYRLLAIRRL